MVLKELERLDPPQRVSHDASVATWASQAPSGKLGRTSIRPCLVVGCGADVVTGVERWCRYNLHIIERVIVSLTRHKRRKAPSWSFSTLNVLPLVRYRIDT